MSLELDKVYFVTPGLIEIQAVTTLGVSAKESDNPIGFFGTGLKYAIAVLLRNGLEIEIKRSDGEHYVFSARPKEIRGKTFQIVYMNDLPLGFTTDLGAKWQLWQAFRELESNTRDESGFTHVVPPKALPAKHTIITVTGKAFVQEFHNRGATFLNTEPLFKVHGLEVHAGRSSRVFYRGVRVYDLDHPSLYTYNVVEETDLTEDRTLKYPGVVLESSLTAALALSKDKEYITTICRTHAPDSLEGRVNFTHTFFQPGETFKEVMKDLVGNSRMRLNGTILQYYLKHQPRDAAHKQANLSGTEQKQLDKALTFLNRIGFAIKKEIVVVDSLGDGILGTVQENKIVVAREAFNMGTKMLAGTIYEEWVHIEKGKRDETRSMQNYLIDTIMTLGEQITGEPI